MAARRLSELNPATYASLEALGICIIDAGAESQIADLAGLYKGLGKRTFGLCDKQTDPAKAAIEAQVERLFMNEEKGLKISSSRIRPRMRLSGSPTRSTGRRISLRNIPIRRPV